MDLNNTEWFEQLLEECKAITTEYGFTSRWSRIEGYHELGKRIIEENENFTRSDIYGEQIVSKVSKALGISDRTLQYAIQFAQKFPDLQTLKIGKDYTWTRVIRELLPENPIKKEKKEKRCPWCNGIIE
jgi:hypothetical protein